MTDDLGRDLGGTPAEVGADGDVARRSRSAALRVLERVGAVRRQLPERLDQARQARAARASSSEHQLAIGDAQLAQDGRSVGERGFGSRSKPRHREIAAVRSSSSISATTSRAWTAAPSPTV
ncbi:MAG: hypothetical protein IPL61_39155 [Myxococcales bacterium]|nr:hypothetical protein [Myxococcales bacterium]